MSNFTDIMLDLETLSSLPNAAITSVGAQAFNLDTGETGETFYMNVSPASSEKAGLHLSGDTVQWWLKQSPEAIKGMLTDQHSLKTVLEHFTVFYADLGQLNIWGNGAGFDNNILRYAYNAVGMPSPWRYSKDRDVRTLVNMAEIRGFDKKSCVRKGVAHNALDDVKFQIEYCCRAWNVIKESK